MDVFLWEQTFPSQRSSAVMLPNQEIALGASFWIPNESQDADKGPQVKASTFPNVRPSRKLQIAPARVPQGHQEHQRYLCALRRLAARQSSRGRSNYLLYIFTVRYHFCSLPVDIRKHSSGTAFLILKRCVVLRSTAVLQQPNTVGRPCPSCPKRSLSLKPSQQESKFLRIRDQR